jgi:hypothetical protein
MGCTAEQEKKLNELGTGVSKSPITNGIPLQEDDSPQVVAFWASRTPECRGYGGCTGTLFENNKMLTAAHCVLSMSPTHSSFYFGNKPEGGWENSDKGPYFFESVAFPPSLQERVDESEDGCPYPPQEPWEDIAVVTLAPIPEEDLPEGFTFLGKENIRLSPSSMRGDDMTEKSITHVGMSGNGQPDTDGIRRIGFAHGVKASCIGSDSDCIRTDLFTALPAGVAISGDSGGPAVLNGNVNAGRLDIGQREIIDLTQRARY